MGPLSLAKTAAVAAAVVAPSAAAISAYAPAPLPGFLSSTCLFWLAANLIVLALRLLASSSSSPSGRHGAAASDHTDLASAAASEHDVFASMVPALHHALESGGGHVSAPAERPQEPRTAPATASAAADRPPDVDGESEQVGGGDVSMDTMWSAIMQRRAAGVRRSETWGRGEQPRVERVAGERAAAAGGGWRRMEVVAMAQDELLRRAESLIRRHHENLRLQRQESEQQRALELHHHRRTPIYSV